MSLNDHLRAILTSPRLVISLNQWHKLGGRPHALGSVFFGLPPDSWQALQNHLFGTGWFINDAGNVIPTLEGRDFLTRINELHRSIDREHKQDEFVTQLLTQLPHGAAVDIGCGPGHSSIRLARVGYDPVYAYDLSPIALAMARTIFEQEGKKAQLYDKDATALCEIDDAALALIFSRGALHYLNQRKLANALKRTLRPGGHVVVELIGVRYYIQLKHFRNSFRSGSFRRTFSYMRTVLRTLIYETLTLQPFFLAKAPEIGYTRRSIRRLARLAGLEIVSIAPAPASVGYFVIMQKRKTNAH